MKNVKVAKLRVAFDDIRTMPVFMLAEPVILLAAVIGFVICVVKSRKKKG